MDNKNIIGKIKAAREAKKITQYQMAERLNMGYRAYQNFETCFTKKLDLERLRQVTDELELDFVQLFENDCPIVNSKMKEISEVENTFSDSINGRPLNLLRLVAENAGMKAENNLLKAEILFLRQIVSKQVIMYFLCVFLNQFEAFCVE